MDNVRNRGPQGCAHLAKEVWRCNETLELVVCGHIHQGHGVEYNLPYDRMQRVYDGIRLGIGWGVFSLIELVVLIIWEGVIYSLLFSSSSSRIYSRSRRERGGGGVTMVNAAVATGPLEEESRAPIVVEI